MQDAAMILIMKFFLAIVLLLTAGAEGPDGSIDPYAALPGPWGWEGTNDCTVSPQTIHFSPDRKQMKLSLTPKDEHGTRAPRREVTYQVLRNIPGGLRLAMDGEKRLDPEGRPVTWDLMLLGNDQFCWHRGDWPGTGCTKSMNRCLKQ